MVYADPSGLAYVYYGRHDFRDLVAEVTVYDVTSTAPTIDYGARDPDFESITKDFYFTDADADGTVDMVVNCMMCRGGLGELRIVHNLANWLGPPELWVPPERP